MPAPGDVICGDLRLTASRSDGLGAQVFGDVWLGEREADDDPLWLTLVDRALTPTPMNVSTFMAGANSMARLRHPALVRVRLVDREAEYAVVGFEALPGAIPVSTLIGGAGCADLVAQTAVEVARGLACLHRAELMHGALCPGSVVLWEGIPVLWQYGVAPLCARRILGPRARQLGGDLVAPEVIAGGPLTPSADVYAWGAVLAAMITTSLGAEAVVRVLEDDVPPSTSAGLVALVREALSSASAGRPRDGIHLLERLLALPAESDAPRSAGAKVTTGEFSDLARAYLAEMSAVERRGSGPIVTADPAGRADSESSGALGRLKLKKAKVASGSHQVVGFVPDLSESPPEAAPPPDGTPLWMAASRSPPSTAATDPPGQREQAPPRAAAEDWADWGDVAGTAADPLEDPQLANVSAALTSRVPPPPPPRGPPPIPPNGPRAADENETTNEDPRSSRQALIAADVLADLERGHDEMPDDDALRSGQGDDPSRVVFLPRPDEAPARARPVAPFVVPRTPGPHGPPASTAAVAVAVLVGALAVGATVVAANQRGGMQRVVFGERQPLTAPPPRSTPRDGRAQRSTMAGVACPPGTAALPHAQDRPAADHAPRVCIDRYELDAAASRPEIPTAPGIPVVGLSLAEAQQRCEARGRRLCTQSEWTLACAGPAGHPYPYGALPRAAACNASGTGKLGPGGAHPECVTPQGAFDLVGNAAEWVAEGLALGGGARTRKASCHSAVRPQTRAARSGVGARCCVDVVP